MSRNSTSKKPSSQEMVQLDSTERSSSPFWRSKTSSPWRRPSKPSAYDPSIPVGAAYSHADLLKYEGPGSSPSSRPRTPPTISRARSTQSPSSSARPTPLSLGSNGSPAGLTKTRTWEANDYDVDVGGFEDLEDDEDEFGLPSIAHQRSAPSSRPAQFSPDSDAEAQARIDRDMAMLGITKPGRGRANSGDISEVREGPAVYPSMKKNEDKILRPQYKEILKDPANGLHIINHPTLPSNATAKEIEATSTRISRINKFKKLLQASTISLTDLRSSAWSGVPEEVRSITWQVLLGYLPTSAERRVTTLERKRKEYLDGVKKAFEKSTSTLLSPISGRTKSAYSHQGRSRGLDENVWHQISIDVPRTSPHIELYGYEATQRSLERILYLWAIRHPTSGYVQGINDLVTPFWQVFLGTYITDSNIETGMDPGQLPRSVIDAVEADTYWCLTKLLDGIQDNYIVAQPGIVRQVSALRDLTHRIDGILAKHLEREGVEFMQFSFRWMNCLLMREVNIRCTIRMWDTYMAEEQGFSEFHLYVCAAFLVKWTEQLVKMDFQEIMMFLQALPTKSWTEKEIELVLSEAFIWQSLFRGSSAHLKNSGASTSASGFT